MIKLILCILLGSVNAHAGKVVMEGIDTTNSTIFVDTTNARIGISTNSPSYRLDVYGDIRATGTIYGTIDPSAISGKLTAPATFYVVKNTDYLTNPATSYWVKSTDYLVAPASFTYQATGLTVLKAGDTMTGSLVGTNAYMSANVTADTMTITGSGFSVGGSTLVVAGGRVGVGTNSPLSNFHMLGADVDAVPGIRLENSLALGGSTGLKYASIFQGGSTGYGISNWANASVIEATALGGLVFDSYISSITFQTARAPKMTITPAGKVGINTTTPGSTLHVNGDAIISGAVTMASSATVGGAVGINSTSSPGVSQLKITSGGAGAISLLNYAVDNLYMGFDTDWNAGWTARNASAALLQKYTGTLIFNGNAGLIPGNNFNPTPRLSLDLTSGHLSAYNGLTASSGTFTGAGSFGGNVGIGTTAPGAKLDISSGTIHMAGTGTPTVGGALCLNAIGTMSKCTSAIDASGNCTCP